MAQIVAYLAKQAGVPREQALYIAGHESHFNPEALGDMDIVCPHSGQPFESRGLFQISSCWYPELTDSEAFDPWKNAKRAMEIINKGKAHCMSQFTTCRTYYKNKN